jgi:hypothetical protein
MLNNYKFRPKRLKSTRKKHFFLGHNGYEMIDDKGCQFSHNFDWIITQNKILKKKENPQTVYIKIDYIYKFVYEILNQLTNPIILISACGDYCPEINFPKEYNILINSPLIKKWYMENMFSKHFKTFSLPVGFATHSIEDENLVFNIKYKSLIEKTINSIDNKIFCTWRNRDTNCCGNEIANRKKFKEFILANPNFFDWYEPDKFTLEQYLNILSKYKYSLCIYGNGIDPNPSAWYSLALNVTPIVLENENSKNIFYDIKDSVLFIKDEIDLLKICIKKPILKSVPIHFLTQDYWKFKILNS